MNRRRALWSAAAIGVMAFVAYWFMRPDVRVVGDISNEDVDRIRILVADSYRLSIAKEVSHRSLSRLPRQLARRFRERGLEIRRTGQWSAEARTGTADHGTYFIFKLRSTGWQLTEFGGVGKWYGLP